MELPRSGLAAAGRSAVPALIPSTPAQTLLGPTIAALAILALAILTPSAARADDGATAAASDEAPVSTGHRLSSTVHHDVRLVGNTFAGALRHELPPDDWEQATYLGGLGALSVVLESHKEDLRQSFLDSGATEGSHWTDIGGELGKGQVTYGAALVLYGSGLFADLPRARDTGLLLGESYALAQTTASLLNFVVSETRPQEGGEIRNFHRGGSSVSLHATNSMLLAEVLDHQLTRLRPDDGAGRRTAKIFGKVVLYSVPAITGYERIRSDQHFLWNVVLGAGQSFYVTRGILGAHDHATGAPVWLPQLGLAAGPDGQGRQAILRWTF